MEYTVTDAFVDLFIIVGLHPKSIQL